MQRTESRIYSQNGEDGVLAHIFNEIGVTNQVAVEFGVGQGWENNSRLLAALGWQVFWFDLCELEHRPTHCVFRQVRLTADNITAIFQEHHVPHEFDLLSIDVDGNDYHLREALTHYRPRVCVMEYNGSIPADQHWIMPRNDNYEWQLWDKNFGASLAALTEQANRMAYDLVYCESRGVNAFFVRRDCNALPVLSVAEAWRRLWWA